MVKYTTNNITMQQPTKESQTRQVYFEKCFIPAYKFLMPQYRTACKDAKIDYFDSLSKETVNAELVKRHTEIDKVAKEERKALLEKTQRQKRAVDPINKVVDEHFVKCRTGLFERLKNAQECVAMEQRLLFPKN
jgi:hypothetical protein